MLNFSIIGICELRCTGAEELAKSRPEQNEVQFSLDRQLRWDDSSKQPIFLCR
jgi:hypothetical protein